MHLSGDAERQMDALREAHHAQVFRLLAQDLTGALTVERLADHLSDLADLMLQVTLELCWTRLRGRHLRGSGSYRHWARPPRVTNAGQIQSPETLNRGGRRTISSPHEIGVGNILNGFIRSSGSHARFSRRWAARSVSEKIHGI